MFRLAVDEGYTDFETRVFLPTWADNSCHWHSSIAFFVAVDQAGLLPSNDAVTPKAGAFFDVVREVNRGRDEEMTEETKASSNLSNPIVHVREGIRH